MSTCLANARSPGLQVRSKVERQARPPAMHVVRVMFDCIASLRLVQRPLLANMRPVDSDDTLVRKSFQGFGKNEIGRAFSLVDPHDSEVCPTVALLDRHHAVVFYPRLEVTVGSRFLPKRVDLRFTTFFDH